VKKRLFNNIRIQLKNTVIEIAAQAVHPGQGAADVQRRERTGSFADHGDAHCSFGSLLVHSGGTMLS
jgi:hypothetical protein